MTYQLFQGRQQNLNSSVQVIPGALAYFYLTGTLTPTDTYTTSARNVAHTNPVEADSGGFLPTIYLNPSIVYKCVLRTAGGALIDTIDPCNDLLISQATIGAALWPITTAEQAAGLTTADLSFFYQPGNLFRYLAVGDDSTDNTTAIQNAIDQAAEENGAAVYVPYGIFRAGQLALASGVTIYGAGYYSCLKLRNSGNNYLLANTNGAQYVDDVTITRIRIDGNKANNTAGGGLYLNGRRNVVLDVDIRDCPNAGLLIGVSSNGGTNTPLAGYHSVISVRIHNCAASNGWGGFAITHGQHIDIQDLKVTSDDGQQTYGVDIEPESGNLVAYVTVNGLHITQGRLFIDCKNLGGSNVGSNFSFTNVHVDASGAYSPSDASNEASPFLAQCKDVSFTNARFIGQATRTFTGIHCEEAGTTTTWNVDGLSLTNVKFSGASAIARPGRFSVCRRVRLDNVEWEYSSASQLIEMPGSTDVRAHEVSATQGGAGAAINLGSTVADAIFYEDCKFTGTVTVHATAAANGCQVQRVLTASQALDFDLTGVEEHTLTVTVTGAAVGDQATVAIPAAAMVANMLYGNPWVSAADTVSIRAQRVAGTTPNPASGTFTARVLKVA